MNSSGDITVWVAPFRYPLPGTAEDKAFVGSRRAGKIPARWLVDGRAYPNDGLQGRPIVFGKTSATAPGLNTSAAYSPCRATRQTGSGVPACWLEGVARKERSGFRDRDFIAA